MRRVRSSRDVTSDEVEVVDDDGTEGSASGPHGAASGDPRDAPVVEPRAAGAGSTRGRHARRAVLGAGGLVLVAALAATGLEAAGERARQERLAAVPGVVGEGLALTQPLQERWRVEATADWAAPVEGGIALADSQEGLLRGVGPDGGTLWRAPLGSGASCIPLAAPEEYAGILGYLSLVSVLDRPVTTVVCEEPGEGLGAWSTADGSETGRLPYSGEVRTIADLGTDLVAVTDDPAGGHVVRRWSPATGEVRWEAPGPAPRRGLPWLSWDVAVVDDVVVVRGTETVRLDAITGAAVREGADADADAGRERGLLDRSLVRVRVLDDGTEVLLQQRRADLPGTVLRDPEGRTRTLDGQVLLPVMSDRRDSGELLVGTADAGGTSLLAYDVAGDAEVWRADGVAARSVLLELEERLVVLGESAVLALDRTSGERLWTAPRAPELALAPVTDGDVALLVEVGTRASNDLVARRLRDGAELWRVSLPAGAVEVAAVADVLLVRTTDGLVGMG